MECLRSASPTGNSPLHRNSPSTKLEVPLESPMQNILIAETNPEIRRFLEGFLPSNSLKPHFAGSSEETLRRALETPPDLVIVNLMDPDREGLAACEFLRQEPTTKLLPILILSEVASEEDRIAGFEAGCDDYMASPFALDELLLRLRALERRCNPPLDRGTFLEMGGVVADTENHTVSVRGKAVRLSPTEFRLLVFLMRRKGLPQSRDTLLSQIWGQRLNLRKLTDSRKDADSESRTVDTHVRRLRLKLEPGDEIVQVVRTVGYVAREAGEN